MPKYIVVAFNVDTPNRAYWMVFTLLDTKHGSPVYGDPFPASFLNLASAVAKARELSGKTIKGTLMPGLPA